MRKATTTHVEGEVLDVGYFLISNTTSNTPLLDDEGRFLVWTSRDAAKAALEALPAFQNGENGWVINGMRPEKWEAFKAKYPCALQGGRN